MNPIAAMVAGMRRRLVYSGAWLLSTGAAVTLSWFGVHTVLAGGDHALPRTLPVSDSAPPGTPPRASSTHRPPPSPSRTSSPPASRPAGPPASSRPAGGGGSGHGAGRQSPSGSQRPGGQDSGGTVRGTEVPGGRAVFDMGDDSASLVSATPDGGWDMQVWRERTWIRVTFSKDGASSSVFCRWDDGPPRIDKYQG